MTPRAVLQHLSPPQGVYPPAVILPDKARSMGIYIGAGRGSGKSRLLGRVLVWQDLMKGVPQIVIDPNSQTIANVLDKVERLPEPRRSATLARIRYIDMGSRRNVVPWPLYTRHPGESLFESSQRFLVVIKRIDPALMTASVEGWNALAEVGTYVGMILAALGWQIPAAVDLLANPVQYASQLQTVVANFPEARSAVSYFLEFLPSLKPTEKERRIGAFLRKIAIFSLDPTMRAMFGSREAGIDWGTVVERGETVLIDFGQVLDLERRRFMMLWIFQSFVWFVKRRGPGRHTPIGLVVDELTALYNFDVQAGSSIFAADLDELINVLARNCRVWLTLANQELHQVELKSRKTLLGMGTKIIGVTSDSEAALTLAREFFRFDPTRIKQLEPIYDARGTLIDTNPVYWSIQEQELLASQRFLDLQPFHFLVKASTGEGNATGPLVPLSIANIDAGIWVNEPVVARLREHLADQSGQPVHTLLAAAHSPVQAQAVAVEEPVAPPPASDPSARDRLDLYAPVESDDDFSRFRETYDPGSY